MAKLYMFKNALIRLFIVLFFTPLLPSLLWSADLQWFTSKQEAFERAEAENKKVLLVAGRDT